MNKHTPIRALRAPVTRFAGLPLHLHPRDRATALVAGLQRLQELQAEMIAKLIAEADALDAPSEDLEDDEREPVGDNEHSCGWESHGGQLRLNPGTDHGEPALGWPERMDQTCHRISRTDHEDEPTNGAGVTSWPNDQRHWAEGDDRLDDEREPVSEDEAAQCDDEGVKDNEDACSCEDLGGEYSLGAQEGLTGSEGWSTGGSPDHEPSLASTHSLDQRWWANHFLAAGVHLIDGEEEHDGCEPDDETDGREDLEPEEYI